jgi:uncharacterized phage protein gp47/JayE
MAYTIPLLDDTAATLLRDISNQLPDADVGKDSDFAIRANAIASAVQGLYQHQVWIVRQMFPDTADHDYLVMHARTRNLQPKPATYAGGKAQLTGNVGVTVKAGLQFRPKGSSLLCQTTEDAIVGNDGKIAVASRPLETGTVGNLADNTPGTLLIAPEGIDGDVIILTMTGGTDDETDASLLARLLEVIRRPAAGGNKYDYHRWAVEVPGVTEAYVYPLRRGYGTVDVVIVANNSMPSEETIKATQAHIDEERPVTAKNTLVLAPEEVTTDVSVKVKLSGLSLDEAKKQITVAITDYFNRLAPGEVAVLKQIGGSITNIVGVIDYEFITPTGNIIPVVDKTKVQWIRLGTVAVDKMP